MKIIIAHKNVDIFTYWTFDAETGCRNTCVFLCAMEKSIRFSSPQEVEFFKPEAESWQRTAVVRTALSVHTSEISYVHLLQDNINSSGGTPRKFWGNWWIFWWEVFLWWIKRRLSAKSDFVFQRQNSVFFLWTLILLKWEYFIDLWNIMSISTIVCLNGPAGHMGNS